MLVIWRPRDQPAPPPPQRGRAVLSHTVGLKETHRLIKKPSDRLLVNSLLVNSLLALGWLVTNVCPVWLQQQPQQQKDLNRITTLFFVFSISTCRESELTSERHKNTSVFSKK